MMDILGISRMIDHALYMGLNALAIVLWRLNAALLGISMLSYSTQDWLTGAGDGGVWRVLNQLLGAGGILGLTTWQVFLALALVLFGISKVLRPLFSFRPVDLGRLLFFAALAYVFISQGSAAMLQLEQTRAEAGSYMYTAMAGSGGISLPIPGGGGSDPIAPPADLDGQPPLRGWEAVASSYFLATGVNDLHASVPPTDFLVTYCLYDPTRPINDQDAVNAEGCSPRLTWDEWDQTEVNLMEDVLGLEFDWLGITTGMVPMLVDHPENRQAGIRQAQAGVARLALGPIVTLFPIMEANIGLMLALAASFIYLSMPVALLFSFFLYTESLVTRLMLQFVVVYMRTLLINGLAALFVLLLISAAVNGSLTVYLGLVGVGLIGGWFLSRLAASTMYESLSQALGAVGGVWMGATTAALGEGARRPAEMALGAAKLAATGATLAAAGASAPTGAWAAWDLARPALAATQSGTQDWQGQPSTSADSGQQRPAGPPDFISRLVKPDERLLDSAPMAVAAVPALNGKDAARNGQPASLSSPPPTPEATSPTDKTQALETWTAQVYQARDQGRGEKQTTETGQTLLGESLAEPARQAMSHHSQADTLAVFQAARETAPELGGGRQAFDAQGRLKATAVQSVRARMGDAARSFQSQSGQRDLAALTAAAWQPTQAAKPEEFRRAAAAARPGRGEEAPGRVVPRALGLDPVAAGAHLASLNQFARVSEQAGLSAAQRQQLLAEVQANDEVTPSLRRQIEAGLRQQGTDLTADEVIASARSLPSTLQGPLAVRLPEQATPVREKSAITASTRPTLPVVAPGEVTGAKPSLVTSSPADTGAPTREKSTVIGSTPPAVTPGGVTGARPSLAASSQPDTPTREKSPAITSAQPTPPPVIPGEVTGAKSSRLTSPQADTSAPAREKSAASGSPPPAVAPGEVTGAKPPLVTSPQPDTPATTKPGRAVKVIGEAAGRGTAARQAPATTDQTASGGGVVMPSEVVPPVPVAPDGGSEPAGKSKIETKPAVPPQKPGAKSQTKPTAETPSDVESRPKVALPSLKPAEEAVTFEDPLAAPARKGEKAR